jgi:CheY-like chemotaxis protein
MGTPYTVLIVEQTDVVRQNTRRALTENGCRVFEAADATEALAVLAQPKNHVDLVLIGAVGGPPAR